MGFFSNFKNKISLKIAIERLMIDVLEIRREIHPAFAKELTKSAADWAIANGFEKDLEGRRMTTAFMSLCAIIESRFISADNTMKPVLLNLYEALIDVAHDKPYGISQEGIMLQVANYFRYQKELNQNN